ncbi:MAG: hypothetical protein HY051_02995 [Candidatus Aenigmarchaeota archaeon]|nr:hypothetical protein [Candidatus Aenigmarchaeota archaeon]
MNFFFFAILSASAYFVSAGSVDVTMELAKTLLSMFFLTAAANTFSGFSRNKVYNIIKKIYRKSGGESRNSLLISTILLAAGFAVSYGISVYTASLYALAALLLWVNIQYLRNVRFVRSIITSAAASVAVILGSDVAGLSYTAYFMALLLFFSNAAGDMVKSITEEMKDRTSFLISLLKHFSSYIRFDADRTRKAAAASLAIFIILSPVPYLLGLVSISYLALITISSLVAFVALFNIVKNGKNAVRLAKTDELIKINMLTAIIAFLAGVLV